MPWVATGVRREVRKEREVAVQGGKMGFYSSNN